MDLLEQQLQGMEIRVWLIGVDYNGKPTLQFFDIVAFEYNEFDLIVRDRGENDITCIPRSSIGYFERFWTDEKGHKHYEPLT